MVKKLLFTAAAFGFAATLGVQRAEAAACAPVMTLNQFLTGGSADAGCELGDKRFDVQTYNGNVAANLVDVGFTIINADQYSVLFDPQGTEAKWTTPFIMTWSWQVLDPTQRIIQATDQMFAGAVGSNDVVEFCASPVNIPVCQIAMNTAGNQTRVFTSAGAQTLLNSAQYAGGTNGLVTIEQAVLQQTVAVPEPGSLMLLGSAFLGWGVALRRRVKARR